MNLLDNAFGIHEQALRVRTTRLETLGRNIANADTPNFKARDIDFRAVLNRTMATDNVMAATQARHLSRGDMTQPDGMKFRVPFNTAFDGNTVETSVEQANYGRAAADYQATLSFLENRVSSIRKALKGD